MGDLSAIVLAAGQGTRMRSNLPKVLHPICGRSLLGHVLTAVGELDPSEIAVVVRHQREAVAREALNHTPGALICDQDEIPGTGRAVWCALDSITADGDAPIMVVAGDTPLLRGAELAELYRVHRAENNAITVLTALVDDPRGYGRIVRVDGKPSAIVEERDATEEQRAIREINTSTYIFSASVLRAGLARGGQANAQGEVYLTDVLAYAVGAGLAVGAHQVSDAMRVAGANDRAQLAELEEFMRAEILAEHMRAGVSAIHPSTITVDVDVEIGQDTVLEPGVYLCAGTRIGPGAHIGAYSVIRAGQIGAGQHIAPHNVIESATTSAGVSGAPE